MVFVVAAVALVAALVAIGLSVRADDESSAGGPAAPLTAAVRLSEFRIEPGVVTVAEGGSLEVTNAGSVPHDLSIQTQGRKTPMLDSGKTASLSLEGIAPGEYTLWCEVPGHREGGMTGKLKVVAGAAAAAPSAAPSAHGNHAMPADEMDAVMAKATKAFPAATKGQGAQLLAPTVLADGTKEFRLASEIVQWEVEPGRFVEAWTYNGTVPGPTIKVEPGDKVSVVLENRLPESTVLHIHGITLPNSLDGVPDITQAPIKPGGSHTYTFTAQSTPAVAMYHSHHNAAKQVGNGMAGAFLVGREPVPPGVVVAQEQVMMLNDTGTIGMTLNGKSFPATAPVVAKQGEWIRMHYMNEGVMPHPMHLHGMAQTVIAKDGFPVPQPYRADTVLVGPGERYTVLVQAELAGTWAWHCHILTHAEREDGMFGMVTALVVT